LRPERKEVTSCVVENSRSRIIKKKRDSTSIVDSEKRKL